MNRTAVSFMNISIAEPTWATWRHPSLEPGAKRLSFLGYFSCMADQVLIRPDFLRVRTALRQAVRTKEKKAIEQPILSSRGAFDRERQTRGVGVKFQQIGGAVWLGGFHVNLHRR